jgi:hypothetical protein
MREIRYKNRRQVDELISPILNLSIVKNYQVKEGEAKIQFPTLPKIFKSPEEYFEKWLQLFIYETYN